ncbi:MAG: hypothetical protein HY861_02645 [Chlamydiia bacterium]|nr:hypothetical protein [Chlamydiia bacterium]
MQRIAFLFILSILASTPKLYAEETGAAAANSAQESTSDHWQNWVFAGSALITAAIGVVIVSLNSGTFSHD